MSISKGRSRPRSMHLSESPMALCLLSTHDKANRIAENAFDTGNSTRSKSHFALVSVLLRILYRRRTYSAVAATGLDTYSDRWLTTSTRELTSAGRIELQFFDSSASSCDWFLFDNDVKRRPIDALIILSAIRTQYGDTFAATNGILCIRLTSGKTRDQQA